MIFWNNLLKTIPVKYLYLNQTYKRNQFKIHIKGGSDKNDTHEHT